MTEAASELQPSLYSFLRNAVDLPVVDTDIRTLLIGIPDDIGYVRLLQELFLVSEGIFVDDILEEFLEKLKICSEITDLERVLSRFTSCVNALQHVLARVESLIKSKVGKLSANDEFLLKYLPRTFTELITTGFCQHAHRCNFEATLKYIFYKALVNLSAQTSLASERVYLAVKHVSEALVALHVQGFLNRSLSSIIERHLREYLESLADNALAESILDEALSYSKSIQSRFLSAVSCCEDLEDDNSMTFQSQLENAVYNIVGSLRAERLFDLIVDYPESLSALLDLRRCLVHSFSYNKLVQIFRQAIQARLLHPGAATSDIIHHYISTIRALRHVDPSGAVLKAVSEPLQRYLRTRSDAIRCIVTMLTGDGDGDTEFLADLSAEGEDGQGYLADDDLEGPDADEQALQEMVRWEPAPISTSKGRLTDDLHDGDVISMLVHVYGTKDLFVSEYRSMLADRLLSKTDFECNRELRTLELLKVRFGESALLPAEVMLRDMAESKRINSNVRTISNSATPLKHATNLVPLEGLRVTIISELFWPTLQTESITLPSKIQAMINTFGHKYHALKAPRALKWKNGLGVVSLTLSIGDEDLDFNVSPLLASLLLSFVEKAEWSSKELAAKVGISEASLHKKMSFWLNQGVIAASNQIGSDLIYSRNEALQRKTGALRALGDEMMEGNPEDHLHAPVMDSMDKFEPFVLGMLTNFDALPLDRIHNMLKMFVVDPPYDRTIEQLSAYMAQLTTEDKVVLEGGVYRRI